MNDLRQAYGQNESDIVEYQNFTREVPVARLYKGEERLERLRKLKREWDPKGVFTSMFLESGYDSFKPSAKAQGISLGIRFQNLLTRMRLRKN